MARRFLLLACVLGGVSAATLRAQAPALTDEFQANTYTTLSQYFPKVAANASGNFVVVWGSNAGQDGFQGGIFGQRYDASGAKQGGEFQVNTYTSGDQSHPSVAMDVSGNFVVVWQSSFQDGSGPGVFGQRFNSAGVPQGSEFRVNTYTSGSQYAASIAMDLTGDFVVVWQSYQDGSGYGIFGQRFDSTGTKQGSEFPVNTYTTGHQTDPSVAMDVDGDFVVAWDGRVAGPGGPSAYGGVSAQLFDSTGTPQGGEIALDYYSGNRPSVAMDNAGEFTVVWQSLLSNIYGQKFDAAGAPVGVQFQANQTDINSNSTPSISRDGAGSFIVVWTDNGNIAGQRFDASGIFVGSEFQLNTYTSAHSHPSIAVAGPNNFVAAWASYQDGSAYGVFGKRGETGAAKGMAVDAHSVTGSSSNTNGVLEAGETVQVAPAWQNAHFSSISLSGTASNLTGPAGPTYTIADDTSDYGLLASGASDDCFAATANCFLMTVSGARPEQHWDATFTETLSDGFLKTWALHVGESFPDVPVTNNFYAYIENIFHNGITGGCAGGNYCPTDPVLRSQMAVFLIKAEHGALYVPPDCTGIFPDVSTNQPFCPFVEQLFHEGVTGGCGNGNYCPFNPVTRAQMSAFLLKAEHGSAYLPPACAGIFGDVACPSLFADWIEQLSHENITGGCGNGNYCPGNPNTRGQMAVFLVKTFGLQLYAP